MALFTRPVRPLALVVTVAGGLLLTALIAYGALAAVTGTGGSAGAGDPERRGFGAVDGRLTVAVGTGDVELRADDVAEVEVTRRFTGRSLLGDRPEARWDRAGDTLTLADECGLIGWCDISYEIRVPRGAAVTVAGGSGAVTAAGFGAGLEIATDNGAVTVTDSAGPLSVETENGPVRGTGITAGEVGVGTENGAVDLAFTAVPDTVTADTENGAVALELPDTAYRLTTATESGSVDTSVTEAADSPHTVDIRTENGTITVHPTD
ncbi:DUF4097 family beta strand repeat-containing protein [Streptomyces sp. RFCAC02]|uniref:DUF4097 family beta strand repeat-containing protein n=1 Tax=Streptomyces sp. RFCAC02 TaxID=2499143 RepID=UPI0010209E49|nr:DUF4097 family beta strand repeat-containing protein [Streptomyces sp. RFCAC02]